MQGKAALDRIWADIKSEYFPDTSDKARAHFATGPLNRAKRSVIRSVLIGLSKSLLFDKREQDERSRQFAALGGVLLLHRSVSEEILHQDLPQVLGEAKDEDLPRAVEYIWRVAPAWAVAGAAFQDRVKLVVEKADPQDDEKETVALRILHAAIHVPDLQPLAVERLSEVPPDGLARLLRQERHPAYVEAVVKMVETTSRYTDLRDIRRIALRLALPELNRGQYRRLVQALTASDTAKRYAGWLGMVREIWGFDGIDRGEAKTEWHRVHEELCLEAYKDDGQQMRKSLQEDFEDLKEPVWPQENDGDAKESPDGEAVADTEDIPF